jgi:hypothetical protein
MEGDFWRAVQWGIPSTAALYLLATIISTITLIDRDIFKMRKFHQCLANKLHTLYTLNANL